MEKILDWCLVHKLNMTPFADVGSDGKPVYAVRLTPWANKAPDAVMYFGYGKTFDLAARMACKQAVAGTTLRMDYAYRPWRTAGAVGPVSVAPSEIPF